MQENYLSSLAPLKYSILTKEQLNLIQQFENEFNSKYNDSESKSFFMIMEE